MARDLVRNVTKQLNEEKYSSRATEKPKMDNARKSRRIYFIDLEDMEFKETMKNARRSLESPLESAIPCKVQNLRRGEACGENLNACRYRCACIVEARESTRKRLEKTRTKDHEDRILGKGFNSLSHYNLVHKFIPMHQAMKIPDAKAAVDEEWEKLQILLAWQITKVRSK